MHCRSRLVSELIDITHVQTDMCDFSSGHMPCAMIESGGVARSPCSEEVLAEIYRGFRFGIKL